MSTLKLEFEQNTYTFHIRYLDDDDDDDGYDDDAAADDDDYDN